MGRRRGGAAAHAGVGRTRRVGERGDDHSAAASAGENAAPHTCTSGARRPRVVVRAERPRQRRRGRLAPLGGDEGDANGGRGGDHHDGYASSCGTTSSTTRGLPTPPSGTTSSAATGATAGPRRASGSGTWRGGARTRRCRTARSRCLRRARPPPDPRTTHPSLRARLSRARAQLTTRHEDWLYSPYTSAHLCAKTRANLGARGGRFEICARLPPSRRGVRVVVELAASADDDGGPRLVLLETPGDARARARRHARARRAGGADGGGRPGGGVATARTTPARARARARRLSRVRARVGDLASLRFFQASSSCVRRRRRRRRRRAARRARRHAARRRRRRRRARAVWRQRAGLGAPRAPTTMRAIVGGRRRRPAFPCVFESRLFGCSGG